MKRRRNEYGMSVQLRMINYTTDELCNPSALRWALQSMQLFMFGPLSLKIATVTAMKSVWNSERAIVKLADWKLQVCHTCGGKFKRVIS